MLKHGMYNSRLYTIWEGMINRCHSGSKRYHKSYGSKNIKVCDEWRKDSSLFLKWAMENGYADDLTIDRIDNDGDYEPSNCRFVSREIQNRNTRLIRSTNNTGFRGVCRIKNGRYRSTISVNKKQTHLGYYDTAYQAAIAYDIFVIENNLEHTKNFNMTAITYHKEHGEIARNTVDIGALL